jgi:hypothetical protein
MASRYTDYASWATIGKVALTTVLLKTLIRTKHISTLRHLLLEIHVPNPENTYLFVCYLFEDAVNNTLYKISPSHDDNLGSISGKFMRYLLRKKWHWGNSIPVIWLPSQFSFYQLLHAHLSSSSGVGVIAPIVAGVPSGLCLIPPHE